MINLFFYDKERKDFTQPILFPDETETDEVLQKRFLFSFVISRFVNDEMGLHNLTKDLIIDIFENKYQDFENFFLKLLLNVHVISYSFDFEEVINENKICSCSPVSKTNFVDFFDQDDFKTQFELNYKLAKGGVNNV